MAKKRTKRTSRKSAKPERCLKTADLIKNDLKCLYYESRLGLETLRFIKHNHLSPETKNYTRDEVQKILNSYVDEAEVKFARTILAMNKDKNLWQNMNENAEARLREYNNRVEVKNG